MRGPWDRQDHQKPFAVDFAKPVGAGFYPEDLDEEKLAKYIKENPEDADALNNLVTMVEREKSGRLVAQNYSQVLVSQMIRPSSVGQKRKFQLNFRFSAITLNQLIS